MANLGSTYSYNYLPQPTDSYSLLSSRIDSPWFIDSGATNHITTSLNNLSLSSPYEGTDKVTVGDG